MIDTSDFRNGLSIILDGEIFQIVEFQHVKPGKGGAFVRTRLKNLRTGAVLDKTFRAGEKMDQAILERKKMSFLYNQENEYVFMDGETYDQVTVPAAAIGPAVKYLKDNTEVEVCSHNDRVLTVELPFAMEFEVVETDPGLRGDTASGGSKPAKLETGAVVQVHVSVRSHSEEPLQHGSVSYNARASPPARPRRTASRADAPRKNRAPGTPRPPDRATWRAPGSCRYGCRPGSGLRC